MSVSSFTVLFSLLKVTEVVMIYDAEKQRPRGNPHIQICSHWVFLLPHAQDKLFRPKEKRTSRRPSAPLMCVMLDLVCLNLLHGGKANQQHPHDTQTFASNMLRQFRVLHICLCLKGIVHPFYFFYSIQTCMMFFFLWNTKGDIMELSLCVFIFFLNNWMWVLFLKRAMWIFFNKFQFCVPWEN